jgi:hypothetical protein
MMTTLAIIQVEGGKKRKELTDTAAVGMVRAQRIKWLAILSTIAVPTRAPSIYPCHHRPSVRIY